VAFTESRNTDDTNGERLIDTKCLSSSVLKKFEIYSEELAEINSIDNVDRGKVYQEQMDLLKCFEEQVSTSYTSYTHIPGNNFGVLMVQT
jgi:hypothetical protein